FKRANMRTVLVTLRQPRQVAAFLQSQGLTHLVDDIYGASSVKAAYQNRVVHKCELLAEAIAQQTNQGYTTQNSWMVGDTEADVIAAKQMGLPSAALSCGVRSADYLKALKPTSLHDGLLSAAQTVVNNQQLQAA
ncbi:MAG: HAD hydrolase-like protein, partial [Cyanobacteria bacterium J06588_5]